MTKYCKGCGARLQNDDENAIGYVPTLDSSYCQRCYRIRHYGDVTINLQQGIESSETFEKIDRLEGVVFWVVDLFAFESSLISRLNQKLPGKKIVLVLTKRDVLPKTLTDRKIFDFVDERLAEEHIRVEAKIILGGLLKGGEEANASMATLDEAIHRYAAHQNIIFMGVANSGKSTLINRLLASNDLTTSRNPGTTIDVVTIENGDHILYDTPGIEDPHSVLTHVEPKDLKTLIPTKPIRPLVTQIYENQSFAVGGLARMDVDTNGKATVVAYFSRSLSVHRGKVEKADALWQRHIGGMLSPTLDSSPDSMQVYQAPAFDGKLDVVIHGIGWFCVSGDIKEIYVRVHKGIFVTFRKAMI
ncbi:GTPase [uncultured Dubosiella sp.]|uniref:GTPase n=1 Tax=uncultured Dubosiella sp. TaxID=1937011 RepID=UPI002598F515|nr:GTPase [uncultured Dubosiella sp.]